jgi:antitoxin (DNA-binding transcriptional repressor) of toxin-antitoxin stability system
MKKRFAVADARERFAELLDDAERGASVVIERRGVQYQLSVLRKKASPVRTQPSRIEVVDPAVADGNWSWNWSDKGVSFRRRAKR